MKTTGNKISNQLHHLIVPLACLFLIVGTGHTQVVNPCGHLTYVNNQSSDCGCAGGPGYVKSCGSGLLIRNYEICSGGFTKGYQLCINEKQKVGTRWKCTPYASWSQVATCAAQAAVCSVACASSATHAGVLCAACIAHYVTKCTGCGFYTCTKTNEKEVIENVRGVATGVCDKIGNTGQ